MRLKVKKALIRAALWISMLGIFGVVIYSVFGYGIHYVSLILLELPNKSIIFSNDQQLLVLSEYGELLEQIDLDGIGIEKGVSDIKLESGGTVLIGDSGRKTILRCNPSTWECRPLPGLADLPSLFLDTINFEIDEERQRIIVSDVARHRGSGARPRRPPDSDPPDDRRDVLPKSSHDRRRQAHGR